MSLIAFKADMQYGFFFSNFVWSTYGSPWLQLAAQGKLGVLPQQACSAFSQVTFGRHHASHELMIGGVERYGFAVSKVRGGLADPSNPRLGELLIPVLIFLMYSSADAYQTASGTHAMGLFTILKIAGPKAFRQPELRTAFSSCRATTYNNWSFAEMEAFPGGKSVEDRSLELRSDIEESSGPTGRYTGSRPWLPAGSSG